MLTDLDFGLTFESAGDRLEGERDERLGLVQRRLDFGVSFLDDCLGGILPNDLILLGAQTGSGKTQLATIIAQSNAKKGKNVRFFALEAENREIERRMKYRYLVNAFVRSNPEPSTLTRLSYRNWYMGLLNDLLDRHEKKAEEVIREEFATLYTQYRDTEFNIDTLKKQVLAYQNSTDLVILDHIHYIDTDGSVGDNRAFGEVIKGIRDTVLRVGIPFIVIAHLRKKDTRAPSVIPGLEEFHGTSDLTKISTKCVLMAPAPRAVDSPSHLWETFIHCPKDRMGGAGGYVAKMSFNARRQSYEPGYELGRVTNGQWVEVTDDRPEWFKGESAVQNSAGV